MGVHVKVARFLIKAPATVKLVLKAVAQHPLALLKAAPLIPGIVTTIGVFRPQIAKRHRIRRRQARRILRQCVNGQARFVIRLPGHGGGHQIVFIARGVRLFVTLCRFTQQAIVPVAGRNLPRGIQVPLFQIAVSGVKAQFCFRLFLRLFTLNIDQPARGATAIQHG